MQWQLEHRTLPRVGLENINNLCWGNKRQEASTDREVEGVEEGCHWAEACIYLFVIPRALLHLPAPPRPCPLFAFPLGISGSGALDPATGLN